MKYNNIIKALEEQFAHSEDEKERTEIMRLLQFYYRKRQLRNFSYYEMTFESAMNKT